MRDRFAAGNRLRPREFDDAHPGINDGCVRTLEARVGQRGR